MSQRKNIFFSKMDIPLKSQSLIYKMMENTLAVPISTRRKVVRLNYTTRKYLVSKEDIDNETFVTLDNRRDQKKATYKSVLSNLQAGKSFEAPLVVNELPSGVREFLDGNNRWDAIKAYIALDPLNKVEVTLVIYENLTDQGKKDVYTLWSKGRPQTTNDVVKQYEEDIPILVKMKQARNGNKLPMLVSIYGSSSSLCFYRLISSYLSAKKDGLFQGGFSGSPMKFVEKAQELTTGDYNIIRQFLMDFQEAFGGINKNPWIKTTPFTALFRIWFENRMSLSSDKMIGYFKKHLVNSYEAKDLHRISGMTATQLVRRKYVEILNASRSSNVFV